MCPKFRLRDRLCTRSPTIDTFTIKPITECKLVSLLNKLKPIKALPSDLIYCFFLKLVAPALMHTILDLVNLSILSGTFTDLWKIQVILPHHKKCDREYLDNNMPMSNLVEGNKVVKIAVHEQLLDHFVKQ